MAKRKKNIVVCVMITVWRRYPVTEICFKGLERLIEYGELIGITIKPLIVYSEKYYQGRVIALGWDGVYAPNDKLGEKHNIGLRKAWSMKFDYFMQLGSDDLMSNKALDLYKKYFEKKVPFFGLSSLYIVNFYTKQAKAVHAGHVFGAGRCISRKYFELASNLTQCEYIVEPPEAMKQFGIVKGGKFWRADSLLKKSSKEYAVSGVTKKWLWDEDKKSGLDYNSEQRIVEVCGMPQSISDGSIFIVDIKCDLNINGFGSFTHEKDVDFVKVIGNGFPELNTI